MCSSSLERLEAPEASAGLLMLLLATPYTYPGVNQAPRVGDFYDLFSPRPRGRDCVKMP